MRSHLSQILVIFILSIGLLLRLPLLNTSFWLDEAAQVLESARPLSQQLQIVEDFQPPLLHLVVHFLLFFSRQEWWLRVGAALIPSLVTVAAAYMIGRKLFSVWIGALAALLLATSSFDIFYAQELRPYALTEMWAALSWLLIVGWLKPKLVQKNTNSILLFILFSVAGWYSSYLYPFIFFTQLGFIFFALPQLRKKLFLIVIAVLGAFLPWLKMFLAQLHAGQSLRTDLPGWEKIVSFDQIKSLALTGTKFTFGVIHLDLNTGFFVFAFVGSVIFLPLIMSFILSLRQKKPPELALILTWLCLPILLAWIVSFFIPILQPKRVLFCLPAFYLFISYLILQPLQYLKKNEKQTSFLQLQTYAASILAVLLFITLNLLTSLQYYTMPRYQREDWRGMHQLILDQYPTSTVALFAFPEAFAPWRWYDDGSYPVITTGVLTTDSSENLNALKKVTDYQTVLVFDYLRDLTDPQHKIDAQLQEYGYKEVNQITPKTGLGIVRVYQRKDRIVGLR